MKYKRILTFIFTFCTLLIYSQINKFRDKISFSLLNEIVKRSNDSIKVSNIADGIKSDRFYFYSRNKKIIPYGYEVAFPFVGKTAIVKYDGLWGLINRDGTFIYYSQTPFEVKLSSYEKFGIFDEKGIFDLKSGKKMESYIFCAEPATPDYFINQTKDKKFQLIKRETGESIYKQEMDTIISQNFLMYNEKMGEDNLLILKKKNKYGVYLSNGAEIQKIEYKQAKFIGKYIALNDGKNWTYSLFENGKLKKIISSKIECISPVFQNDFIGIFKASSNKYNLLKVDGSVLSKEFDYINEGTFGIDGNTIYIFTSKGDFYEFYQL